MLIRPKAVWRQLYRSWFMYGFLCFIIVVAISFSIANVGYSLVNDPSNRAFMALPGGHTVRDASKNALGHAYKHMTDTEEDNFILGKSFFRVPWVEAPSATTARDGLGPLFNANSCLACHPGNGSGSVLNNDGAIARSMVFKLALQNKPETVDKGIILKASDESDSQYIGINPESVYGIQLNINGVHGVAFEGTPAVQYRPRQVFYPDNTRVELRQPDYQLNKLNYGEPPSNMVFSPRLAPSLVGLGEIEKIDAALILKNEDVDDIDNDGISGKANYYHSPVHNSRVLGRFTWKASSPSVKYQVAVAMHQDMGLTNPLFVKENCMPKQLDCINAPQGAGIDVTEQRLNAVSYYITHLAIPEPRKPQSHRQGLELFQKIQCASCHITTFTTRENKKIYPFSDFLLHDMGDGLADQMSEFNADGREWRTAPLWGIGLKKTINKNAAFLHDGRARTLEEAILWHGGEAEQSKQKFMQLEQYERVKIIEFLRSL